MRIWVTGARGMLGQEVVNRLGQASSGAVDFLTTDRELDITNSRAVDSFLSEQTPIDWIVNCAAWTAVDAAENNQSEAALLNVEGPRVLADYAARYGAAMLHISTDYVFSGEAKRPYRPDDATNPESVYGRTKRDGEMAVREALHEHVILRSAWLYGAGGKNFVTTMLRLMNEREELGVVADQYGLPTYAPDLATAIVEIARQGRELSAWGTYHYTNAGEPITWHDFATAIYERGRSRGLIMSDCRIKALTTAEYPTRAPRPAYSVLDSSNTTETFGMTHPNWRDSLNIFLDVMRTKQSANQ